jgi:hypothetical protein
MPLIKIWRVLFQFPEYTNINKEEILDIEVVRKR